jgi:hypothetical protein
VHAQSFAKAIRTDMMSLSHSRATPRDALFSIQDLLVANVQNEHLNSTAMTSAAVVFQQPAQVGLRFLR